MKLCPLVPGTIVVSGVKWSLSETVSGFHKFQRKGKLLQNSREHRANRVRAKDTSMTFTVCESLPWLSIQVEDMPETILYGQVHSATMTIRNQGRASACNVRLHANVSWLYVGEVRHDLWN